MTMKNRQLSSSHFGHSVPGAVEAWDLVAITTRR